MIFFEGFEFLVCSKFNHTQCGRTCECAVACLCPRNSISNVVVSVTIHDDTHIFTFLMYMSMSMSMCMFRDLESGSE